LATTTPVARDRFGADLRAALQIADSALITKTRSARLAIFQQWTAFCTELGRDPSLCSVPVPEDRLCYLLVFGHRYRQRTSRATGNPVRSSTVEDVLLAVGQGITQLGGQDPRRESAGSPRLHPLLTSFLRALADDDAPAGRAHPANLTILRGLPAGDPVASHLRDLCILGFFWLLRPSEYLSTTHHGRTEAFRLRDVTFVIDGRILPATTVPLNDLKTGARVSRAILTFNDQKNAVRGEQICHSPSGDLTYCPCRALARICSHLLAHGERLDFPLYRCAGHVLTAPMATSALRTAAASVQATTGIPPDRLSVRSLRLGGATAMLCANIDSDLIKLVGRWKSDAMLRYLRVGSHEPTSAIASRMHAAGSYTFSTLNPTELPDQTPPSVRTALTH